MLGIIRVLSTNRKNVLKDHGEILMDTFSIQSVTKCISNQPNGIYDEKSEKIAIPKIIKLAQQMAKDTKIKAITISCAADPGLDKVKELINIPILGAGICGSHAVSMMGKSVAIIGITEEVPFNIKKELGERFHSYSFSTNLRKTTDLFGETAKDELLNIAKDALSYGADSILFACTGFSTIRLKDYLVKHIDVPVIDLVEAQGIGYRLVRKDVWV